MRADADLGAVARPTDRPGLFDPPGLGELRTRPHLSELLYPDGHVGWLVTSHALAQAVLMDPRFSMLPFRRAMGPAQEAEFLDDLASVPERAGVVIQLDPPQHTRIRRMQTGHFSVRSVEKYREVIEAIVAERLEAMLAGGEPADLVRVYARPVASLTLCHLLGVPSSDSAEFERLTSIRTDETADPKQRVVATDAFREYCRAAIVRKRADPDDDLLSIYVQQSGATDDELLGMSVTLFEAGHDTTANALSLGVFVLLQDRSRWDALLANPGLTSSAVEELVRYLSIFPDAFTRTATEDIELEGRLIKAGQSVTVSLGAANRDPDRFAEPDTFDLARDASGHLGFGHGRHMCLGMHLARLELEIAIAQLIERFPTLRLAVPPEKVPLHPEEHILFGVRALPVAWE